jgi:UDP-glucose 4-epimerase
MERGSENVSVLVTGGAGFIGANLVRLLLEQGHRVRVLDNFSTGQKAYLAGLDLQVVEGDVRDADTAACAVSGMGRVVHLAAHAGGVPGSLQNPRRDCEVNVVGTLNLLEACRHAGVGRFVFASSNAPLGRQQPPAAEDKAPLPMSPYGASKLAGEGYCLAYYGSWGLGTVVLRFANVYGPYSAHKDNVIARFFRDILTTGRITVDGDGQQTHDFVYAGDLCRAILLGLESDVGGEVFQIATGVETSVLALVEMMREVTSRPVEVAHGPARRGDIRKNYSAVGKARAILGWAPQVALPQGLALTWRWTCQQSTRGRF